MLWALAFFVLAMASALLGFGMAEVAFGAMAKLVFYIAVVLCAISLIAHLMRRV